MATNELLQTNKAKAIYNIDDFVAMLTNQKPHKSQDDLIEYCKSNPTYDEAVIKYGNRIFEYELLGKIEIENGKVKINI